MPGTDQPMSDEEIERLEAAFVAAAGRTFSAAFRQARLDFPVVVSEDGEVVELTPDGRRRLIKMVPKPIPAKPGMKYVIE